MNKKGVEITLESILGFVLGALVILGLFVGTSKIIGNLVPREEIDDFNGFKEKIAKVLLIESEKTSSLVLNYNDIVFSLSKSKPFSLSRPINYKNPLTNQENIISSIQRPSKCRNFACICKCRLSDQDIQAEELKCKQENLDCLVIQDIENIEGSLIANYVRDDKNNPLSFEPENKPFLIISISELETKKKTDKDSFIVPLQISKEGEILKVYKLQE